MISATRDNLRQVAEDTLNAHAKDCPCGACLNATAVLRYVPSGKARRAARDVVESLDMDLPSAMDGEVLLDACTSMTPDEARIYALAILAAADAAES